MEESESKSKMREWEREPPYLYGYPATYRWHDYAATMLQFSL